MNFTTGIFAHAKNAKRPAKQAATTGMAAAAGKKKKNAMSFTIGNSAASSGSAKRDWTTTPKYITVKSAAYTSRTQQTQAGKSSKRIKNRIARNLFRDLPKHGFL
jgi:hypothetical protein